MTEFKFGDRVVHHGRPEWGTAVVTAAQNLQHEGKPCQRLTLRFDRIGLKTVSTAIADIRVAGEGESGWSGTPGAESPNITISAQNWLESLEAARTTPQSVFEALPEACLDPFSSIADRLKATLALYRFTPDGASLLDWAAMQTGLADPLAALTRQQLEQYFERFSHARTLQLKELMRDASLQDPLVRKAIDEAPAGAAHALRRFHVPR